MSDRSYDVIVVGGGSAGMNAALASARMGARTALIERFGHPGGTAFELGNSISYHNNRKEPIVGGIAQEIVDRMVTAGGAMQGGHLPNPSGVCGSFTPLESDVMKVVLLEMMDEAGVEMYLHSSFVEPVMDGSRVAGAVIHNKSGVQELSAKIVIDSTGDADVAAQAGVTVHQDTPETALNATLMFRLAAVDTDAFIDDIRRTPQKMILLEDPYFKTIPGLTPEKIMAEQVQTIYDAPYLYLANIVRDYIPESDWLEWEITGTDKPEWGRLRFLGSRVQVTPSPVRKDVLYVNATAITFDATDGSAWSQAELEGQRQIRLIIGIFRRYLPGFSDCYLLGSMPKVSIRASRRIEGEYELTRDDVAEGRRFPDGIARGAYPMSVQSTEKPNVRLHLYTKDGGDYDIPYRCLVPKGVDGLLVAGRCLSATREASGSARIGATCQAYGHAAGVAAALAVDDDVAPRDVDTDKLRGLLLEQNAIV
tara:strand:- start:3082 stop:4521 length:1440 start_codon:yes stop_codon:yes gene_type:complete